MFKSSKISFSVLCKIVTKLFIPHPRAVCGGLFSDIHPTFLPSGFFRYSPNILALPLLKRGEGGMLGKSKKTGRNVGFPPGFFRYSPNILALPLLKRGEGGMLGKSKKTGGENKSEKSP